MKERILATLHPSSEFRNLVIFSSLLLFRYQKDEKGKVLVDSGLVRKTEIAKHRVKRKLWKPYSRKESAIGGLERTRSATKVSSSVQNEVTPENTEIQSVVIEDASASFSTTESIDSIPTQRHPTVTMLRGDAS